MGISTRRIAEFAEENAAELEELGPTVTRKPHEKVGNTRSKYRPIELSDESVYDMAQRYYSAEEIAKRFNISDSTLLKHYGDAFHAGRDDAMGKPRMLLAKIFRDFEESGANFASSDVPLHNLLKATELHGKFYEKFGQKTEVVHSGNVSNQYDAVQTQPKILERPDE